MIKKLLLMPWGHEGWDLDVNFTNLIHILIPACISNNKLSIVESRLCVCRGMWWGWGCGWEAGYLWDLQFNLPCRPSCRLWLREVRASLVQLSGSACHPINTGLLPTSLCLPHASTPCLLSLSHQLLPPVLNQWVLKLISRFKCRAFHTAGGHFYEWRYS